MSRARRIKPSTVEGRKRRAELGKIISNSRTPKAERAAALEELDRIAPVEGTLQEKNILSDIPPAKPTTSDNLAPCARVDAARKTSFVVPPFVPIVGDRERAIQRAKNASPAEKAEVILADLPDHPLNKLARELEQWLWNEDRSNPKPPVERMSAQCVKHWLSDAPHNRSDIRSSRASVDAAVANALKLVADLDAADPNWFARRAEANV